MELEKQIAHEAECAGAVGKQNSEYSRNDCADDPCSVLGNPAISAVDKDALILKLTLALDVLFRYKAIPEQQALDALQDARKAGYP